MGKCKLNVVDGIKNVCAGSVCSYVIQSRCYYEVFWSKKLTSSAMVCAAELMLPSNGIVFTLFMRRVCSNNVGVIVNVCSFSNFYTFKICQRSVFVFPNGPIFANLVASVESFDTYVSVAWNRCS